MGVIKVYGGATLTSAMRVFACLYEKELEFEFEFVPIDMRADEHKKEPYISLNPFGQLPAFEDGDLKLFESRAIAQYIAHEYAAKGSQLICTDSKKMAIQSVWMETEAHQFYPVASKLTWELVINHINGIPTDEAVVEEYEAKLAKVLDVYEARLAQSKYLAGNWFTLADLNHMPNIHYLMGTRTKKLFDSRPYFSAWVADITARPAWSKVLTMQNI